MVFNSLYFLLAFLPVALLLYYVTPKKLKNIILVLISFVFYSWGEPQYLLVLLFSIVFNYLTGLELQELKRQKNDKLEKIAMISGVVVNLLLLGSFKYMGFLIGNINGLLHTSIPEPGLSLPLGISFFTFSALSYILDVHFDKCEAQRNPLSFALYISFFPKVMSGPIARYVDMEEQLKNRQITPVAVGEGLNLLVVGLAKKVLLADNLGAAFSAISQLGDMSSLTAVLGVIFYGLQLYYDFSGYSDMAIGIGRLMGFELPLNFDHPYMSKNISEFWRRWHITLGMWFRNYVYIPMGGNRCSQKRQLINLATVWLLTGLWHGASWSFVFWGLYHGLFVVLEKFVIKDRLDAVPKGVRVFLSGLVVYIGWVFFFSPTLGDAMHYFGQILGAGHKGLADGTFVYYLTGNLVLMIAGFLGCSTLPRDLYQKYVLTKKTTPVYLSILAYLVLFGFCIAAMVSSTFSSFLYFQF